MIVLWIMIIVIFCLLVCASSALIILRFQYRTLDKMYQEREAWQQAQEARQRTWEVRQSKHLLEEEKKLADQLKDIQREWREWSLQIEQSQQEWQKRATVEQELARLLHVDSLELSPNVPGQHQQPERWQPPSLYGADLRGRDLSHRYLQRADLRDTQLAEANLYMADLSGASLTGADLSGANLIGANLSGADLRDANLSGANFLVADLHGTILHRAILLNVRNLTAQQLQTAIYDRTTLIDMTITDSLPPTSSGRSALAQQPDTGSLPKEEEVGTATSQGGDETATNVPVPDKSLTNKAPETPTAESTGTDEEEQKSEAHQPAVVETVILPEAPAHMLSVGLEESSDESHEDDKQEAEHAEEKKEPSDKIIQLQKRAGNPSFLASSKKQHNIKKRGSNNGTSRAGHAGNKSRDPYNQKARAH